MRFHLSSVGLRGRVAAGLTALAIPPMLLLPAGHLVAAGGQIEGPTFETTVNQMDQLKRQNAAVVESSTITAHTLVQETEQLAQLVSRFRLSQPTASNDLTPPILGYRPLPQSAPEPAGNGREEFLA